MKWSKEEQALSDRDFPHRVMLRAHKPVRRLWGPTPSDPVPEMLSPQSDVMVWLMENVGITAKPTTTMINLFSRNGVTLVHNASAPWMAKTQGRDGYKFYFRNAADAITFKLMFAERYAQTPLS